MKNLAVKNRVSWLALLPLCFSAQLMAAEIKQQSLPEVLDEISEYYRVFFSYDTKLLADFTIHYELNEAETLEEAVVRALANTGLRYTDLDENYIVVYRDTRSGNKTMRRLQRQIRKLERIASDEDISVSHYRGERDQHLRQLFDAVAKTTVERTVRGLVVDENGNPLIGATIRLKETTRGAVTDIDGNFEITVGDGPITLVVSYIGFATTELTVAPGQTQLDVVLETEGRITSTRWWSSATRPLPEKTLRSGFFRGRGRRPKNYGHYGRGIFTGLVSGVNVRAGGRPGEAARVEIRGAGSLINNEPFYVIDGLPATDANRDFNPNDVASIQVIKDASAAAIYGARAANGVIIITTKQGKEGPMRVAFSTKLSSQSIPKRWDLTNAAQFAELNRTAYENAGVEPQPSVSTEFDPAINTDWQDLVYRRGYVQDYNLSFSGGGKTGSYYVSGNYFDNYGTIRGGEFDRYAFRVNTEGSRGIFTIGENLAISRSNQEQIQGSPFIDVVRMLPTIPLFDSNNPGGYGYGSENATTFATNPVAINALQTSYLENVRIRGNFFSEVQVTPWLKYRFNLGVETNNDISPRQRRLGNWTYNQPQVDAFLSEQRTDLVNTLYENTINIDHTFGGLHSVAVVAGTNIQKNLFRLTTATKTGYVPDAQGNYFDVLNQGATPTFIGGIRNEWQSRSYFGRVNYGYANRYLLSATLRRDEDSRFSPDERVGIFPSVAVGWNISEESFFEIPAFDQLKLRYSYGRLGNVTISEYQYLGFVNPNPRYAFGDEILVGATQTELVNTDLKWEDKEVSNLGLDASLWNNALSLTAEYFIATTNDVLTYAVPFPNYLGGSGNPPVNAASLQNRGVELSLNYRRVSSDLSYEVGVNFTRVRNEILELGNLGAGRTYIQNGGTRSEVGRSIGEFYLLETDGLFQSEEEVASHGAQSYSQPGDIRYVDQNDDGEINDDDRVYAGSPWPDFQAGIIGNISYRNFSLNIQLYGVSGGKVFNTTRSIIDRFDDNSNYRVGVQPWTEENPNTDFPRVAFSSDRAIAMNTRGDTDRWLENASYLRLRNVQLAYDLPTDILDRIGFNSLRLSVSAQNLLTLTGYTGLDPELTGPNFFQRGVDAGNYPVNRIFSFGLNTSF